MKSQSASDKFFASLIMTLRQAQGERGKKLKVKNQNSKVQIKNNKIFTLTVAPSYQ